MLSNAPRWVLAATILAVMASLGVVAPPASAQATYYGSRLGLITELDHSGDLPQLAIGVSKTTTVRFALDSNCRVTKDGVPASSAYLRLGDKVLADLWRADDGTLLAYRLDASTSGARRVVRAFVESVTAYDDTTGKIVLSKATSGAGGILQVTYDSQTLIRKDGLIADPTQVVKGDRVDLFALEVTGEPLLATKVEAQTNRGSVRLAVLSGYVEKVMAQQVRIRQKNGYVAVLRADQPGRIWKNDQPATMQDLLCGDEISAWGVVGSDSVMSIARMTVRSPDFVVENARVEQVLVLDSQVQIRLSSKQLRTLDVIAGTLVKRGEDVIDFSEIPVGTSVKVTVLDSQNGGPWIATSIQFDSPQANAREAAALRSP
ncbi:MAG TPA: hypothetical protein VGN26_13190 [Armatimonadota bacterium]|jgi:hypothetical protein